ncbi:MAG: Lrp/AsnC family transcriptional regulator, leucine-responsive regulatory protein [archaeon GW2011_AR3]|nr:MAG: Lrp/AsnC family transcriptional regulator, leucine-responsive regulatory protein [archaeon GW2011_AR3]
MQKQDFSEIESSKQELLVYGPAHKFDKFDKILMKALNQNARQSLADLSKKVGLSRDAIRNRIQKLIKDKVITNFKPILNPPAMGFPIINYVFIALHNPTPDEEKKFISFMKGHKNITYVASLIGKWDFIIDVMAENPGKFNDVLKELRQNFADLIKDYEVYGVLEEQKYEEIAGLLS